MCHLYTLCIYQHMYLLIWELAQNNVKDIQEDRFGIWPV